MSTGLEYTNFVSKRVLGTADFKERFLQYLLQRVTESNREQYSSAFFHPKGVVMAGDGSNSFEIVESPPGNTAVASDGYGNFLEYWNSLSAGVKFENLNTIIYYVGLKYASYPVGIQINPDHGQPEYVSFRDEIGESANPNSVTDNGDGTIDFRVDSVLETGVDNTGRIVLVYKTIPASGAINESIAIEQCVVFYSGGQNYIQTTGDLGQGTINPEEDVYTVFCPGPTVKRYTDLRTQAGYCYVGYITGNAGTPSLFNYDDQKVIDHNWTDILIYGLDQDFWPKVDATYKLGRATHQWSEIHTVDFLMSGDFLPVSDNAQDIGATGKKWADGWFGGKVECNDFVLNGTAPGGGVMSHIEPSAHNAWAIGDSTYWFGELYSVWADIDNLTIDDSGTGAGVRSGLVPETTDMWDLGIPTYRWNDVNAIDGYFELFSLLATSGEGCVTDFVPTVGRSVDLGNSSYLWDNLHVGVVFIDNRLELTYNDPTPVAGVHSTLDPTTDNTFNLGVLTARWANVESRRGAFNILKVDDSGSTTTGVETGLLPNADDTRNFGSIPYRWNEGHIKVLYLASGGGGPNGIDSDCQPGQTDHWTLGDSSYRWDEIEAKIVDARILDLDGGSSGIGCISDFRPGALDLTLGDSSYNWDILYLDVLDINTGLDSGCTTDFEPVANGGSDLGSFSYEWENLWVTGIANIDKLVLDTTGGTGFGVGSDVLPEADNTYDLGSFSFPWDDLWVGGIANIDKLVLDATGGTGFGVGSDVLPEDTNFYDLGSISYSWDYIRVSGQLSVGEILINTTPGSGGMASSMFPKITDSYSLGDDTYYWENVYTNNLYYKTTFTTFDDVDDLRLISKYAPTDETVTIVKNGKTKIVKKADPNTIPWPMLGTKDPTKGDHFLHAGDSITFLLGAIKQLHKEHKKALGRIAQLEAVTMPI